MNPIPRALRFFTREWESSRVDATSPAREGSAVRSRRVILALTLAATVSFAAARDEPVRGFVTVEPFEIRVEAICRPVDFRDTWEIREDVLAGPSREKILENALQFLRKGTAIQSPGRDFAFDSAQVRYIVLSPDLGYVPDDRESIPLSEALVGVSMSALAEDVGELTVKWNWRAPGQEKVPVQLTVGTETMARFLTEEYATMNWIRQVGSELEPKLLPVPPVERGRRSHQPLLLYGGLGFLGCAGLLVLFLKTRTPSVVFFLLPLAAAALFGAFRFAPLVPLFPGNSQSDELVYSLLRNTYHAFDFRDESDIYDILGESIAGPLLESVYLEVRQGLELETQGGPRVRIKGVDLRETRVIDRNNDAGTFDIQSEWVAVGDVTHWGHSHLRTNRYRAILRIGAFDETWKITRMRLLEEERTQQVTRIGEGEPVTP